MSLKNYQRLALFATFLALAVIVLGAYVRLSDAGLGCPDWPGCYGHLDVPKSHEIPAAEQAFPDRPVERGKAWKEMIHRYFAGVLGLLILALAWYAYRLDASRMYLRPLSAALIILVCFQALLGMWTVTLLVKPAIVTLHLIFGMMTGALLWLLWLSSQGGRFIADQKSGFEKLGWVALLVTVIQIALGGWTSTNYSALACTAFPGCYIDQAWPMMNFAEGFTLWRGLGVNYEFGVLDSDARAAIHMTHRMWAIAVFIVVGILSLLLIRSGGRTGKTGTIILILLILQICLGVANVLLSLPIMIAVAHNGVAALLIGSLIFYLFSESRATKQ